MKIGDKVTVTDPGSRFVGASGEIELDLEPATGIKQYGVAFRDGTQVIFAEGGLRLDEEGPEPPLFTMVTVGYAEMGDWFFFNRSGEQLPEDRVKIVNVQNMDEFNEKFPRKQVSTQADPKAIQIIADMLCQMLNGKDAAPGTGHYFRGRQIANRLKREGFL